MPRLGASTLHLVRYPLILVVLLLAACTATSGRVGVPPPGSTAEAIEVMKLVNEARSAARSCGDRRFSATTPVSLEARLARAAQLHSSDMRESGVMSHTGSDGSDLKTRAERQGYEWSRLGENVAAGYQSPSSVVAGWLSSPGHCANIMNPDFTELGVGLDGVYWTQLFGRPL